MKLKGIGLPDPHLLCLNTESESKSERWVRCSLGLNGKYPKQKSFIHELNAAESYRQQTHPSVRPAGARLSCRGSELRNRSQAAAWPPL